MGVSLSTARYIAPASFIYDFALQQYGLNSTPNMQQVHDRNLSFWSPQPYFIGAFFFPQQFFQLAWLYKLWKLDDKSPAQKRELDQIVKYVPFYVLGNLCIGTWMFFWNSEQLKLANVFVVVNSTAQLFYVMTQMEPMDTKSWPSILTHVVAKTFAGIGILDFLHNTSVAYYKDVAPGAAVKAITGLGFAALASMSDWIFGGCLVWDLVGLSVGQSIYQNDMGWSQWLGGFAVGTAAIVGFRNYLMPPYVKGSQSYQRAAQEEVDDRA